MHIDEVNHIADFKSVKRFFPCENDNNFKTRNYVILTVNTVEFIEKQIITMQNLKIIKL